jgi:outer membrane protein OmpA-like peptidoglycan-associated protein
VLAIAFLSGCATKGYVRDEMKQMEDRVAAVEGSANTANSEARGAKDLAMQGDQKAQQALMQAELARDIALGNVAREEVRTAGIYFAFNSANLNEDARMALNGVADELRANPNYMVLLSGYADPTGDEQYNLQLAERRAAACRLYLAQQLGSDFVRIANIGYGEVASTDVEGQSRLSNKESRRVDAEIVRPVATSHTGSGSGATD